MERLVRVKGEKGRGIFRYALQNYLAKNRSISRRKRKIEGRKMQ